MDIGGGINISSSLGSGGGGGGGGTSIPTAKFITSFETAGRHDRTSAGGGGITFGSDGAKLDGFDTLGFTTLKTSIFRTLLGDLFNQSPIYTSFISITGSSAGEAFMGVGGITNAASGHTFTQDHFGFKLVESGGTTTLFATQGDGTTETASSALTTVVNSDTLDLIAVKDGTTKISYYFRKNGGVLSSATELTTNMPTPTDPEDDIQHSTNTSSTGGGQMEIYVTGASYER